MGGIQSLFGGGDAPDVPLDFENAEPTEREAEIYNAMNETLQRGQLAQQEIEEYKGCQDLARKAMANATLENEEAALDGLLICVRSIKHFFEQAQEVERSFPMLLEALARPNGEHKQSLAENQALAKQLAMFFDFTLLFDQTRMLRPFLSNDFSYYRRLLPKFSKSPKIEVREDEANAMAMFTAEHIPMMNAISKSASRMNRDITEVLATLANSCLKMLKTKRYQVQKTNLLCARAMTGAIVLFDHVAPLGVFHRKSPIQVKQCILTLKKEFPNENALLNAIRFSSKHFNDDSTPSSIQSLFD